MHTCEMKPDRLRAYKMMMSRAFDKMRKEQAMVSWSQFDLDSYDAKRRAHKPPGTPECEDAVERESDLHEQILLHCRRNGWAVTHSRMDRPSTCGIGTADFVIAADSGRTLYVECKSGRGKLSPEQNAYAAMLAKCGHTLHVVRSFDDFIRIVTNTNERPQ